MKRIVFAVLLLFCLTACSNSGAEISGFSMDAPYLVKGENIPVDTQAKIREYLSDTDFVFSAYRDDSCLSELNDHKKLTVSADDENAKELYTVIEKSLPYCNDFFDISIRPVTKLWDFTAEDASLPDEATLQNSLKSVDAKNIILEDDFIFLENDAEIELGAVAKGYACDRISEMLFGYEALVDIGGTIKSVGKDSTVGIKTPSKDGILCSFTLPKGKAVATSGSYERNFTVNGDFYHHILNPKTGYPFESDLVSVSVICDSAMEADILATTFFAKGNPLLTMDNVQIIFVTKDKEVFISGSVENFKLLHNGYTVLNEKAE